MRWLQTFPKHMTAFVLSAASGIALLGCGSASIGTATDPTATDPTATDPTATDPTATPLTEYVQLVLPLTSSSIETLGIKNQEFTATESDLDFVLAVERFVISDCCKAVVAVQDEIPLIKDEYVVERWSENGFAWALAEFEPFDGTNFYATATFGTPDGRQLAVSVNASILFPDFLPSQVDVASLVRGIVANVTLSKGISEL